MFSFLKEIIQKYINKSQYKKNILIMVGGRAIAQVIPILITPLFTRLYSPQEYGIFSIYTTIVSIIAMISNGRYCLSIVLPKEKRDSTILFYVSSLLTIITTLLFFIFLIGFGDFFFNLLNASVLKEQIILIGLNTLFVGLYEPLFYYVLREKRYKTLATNIIGQSLVLIIIRIVSGYLGYTGTGLMLSYLGGYVFSYFLLLVRSGVKVNRNYFGIKKYGGDIKRLLVKYINFPKYSLFAGILRLLSAMSPNIILNKMFGSTEAGYYSLSDKVLGSPIYFITSSVGDVFKQEAAEQYRETGSCKQIFEKTAKSMFLLGLIPFLLIFLVFPYFVTFIFGDNWQPAEIYIRVFAMMYFARFVFTPLGDIVEIIGKQGYRIIFESLRMAAIIVGLYIGYYFDNLTLGIIIWSVLTIISYLAMYVVLHRLAKETKNEVD